MLLYKRKKEIRGVLGVRSLHVKYSFDEIYKKTVFGSISKQRRIKWKRIDCFESSNQASCFRPAIIAHSQQWRQSKEKGPVGGP
jgi:hypothetical protein